MRIEEDLVDLLCPYRAHFCTASLFSSLMILVDDRPRF